MISEEYVMKTKTYLIIAIVAAVAALIGLVKWIGGMQPVNIGTFVFPMIIAMWSYGVYLRKRKK